MKYDSAYIYLNKSLQKNLCFKNAVFVVENCFDSTKVDYKEFNATILSYSLILKDYVKRIKEDNFTDTVNFAKNGYIYHIIKDTTILNIDSFRIRFLPFTYNFIDPSGALNWSNTFVTKLLVTHQGNCRSLAYFYKILADELGAKCWLALAPNHIYVRNYSNKIGWYNTELTSGTFPTDAWIMATGYVNPEAIKSGLYMDTLSNQQAIALCVTDLAKGYESQTHNYYDGFILKCCDLALKYHPVNPMALLLKAETLKKVYLHEKEIKFPRLTVTPYQMGKAYIALAKLGYREMPDKMYQKWLKSITEQKDKYTNKKIEE